MVKAAAITTEGATEPPKGVKVPKGHKLVAVLPSDATAMPLKEHAGLAVFLRTQSKELHKLGGGLKVELLPKGKVEGCLLVEDDEGALGLARLTLEPFEDDPEKFTASKLGGLPNFCQEELAGNCPKCRTSLRFAAQFECPDPAPDGMVYVFVCPKGCAAQAAMQR